MLNFSNQSRQKQLNFLLYRLSRQFQVAQQNKNIISLRVGTFQNNIDYGGKETCFLEETPLWRFETWFVMNDLLPFLFDFSP